MNPEKRVLDLRPWTEITVEAMAEIIRVGLTEAGIHTLAWDHAPSEPTRTSAPKVQKILIDQFADLYPHPSGAKKAAHPEGVEATGPCRDETGTEVRQLVSEMAALMAKFVPALQRRAASLAAGEKAGDLVDTLRKGADAMQGSGNLYLTWARHYAALGDNTVEQTDET
jgi:hypothetical protein